MESFDRLINRLYPEIKAGYHLPLLGRIERITKAPVEGGACTQEEPLYAVDIQPIDEHFKDIGVLFRDVVLGMGYAGQDRGFFALPDPGCIVEFCFPYASPKIIFIRGVIPWGMKLPPLDTGEAKWCKNREVWQGYDKNDNWHRHTTGSIEDSCSGAMSCTAEARQLFTAPKTWLGSDTENVLKIVVDCLSEMETAIGIIAKHTHDDEKIGSPDNQEDITHSVDALEAIRTARLEPITE